MVVHKPGVGFLGGFTHLIGGSEPTEAEVAGRLEAGGGGLRERGRNLRESHETCLRDVHLRGDGLRAGQGLVEYSLV